MKTCNKEYQSLESFTTLLTGKETNTNFTRAKLKQFGGNV